MSIKMLRERDEKIEQLKARCAVLEKGFMAYMEFEERDCNDLDQIDTWIDDIEAAKRLIEGEK